MKKNEKKLSFIVNLTKRQLSLLGTIVVFSITLIFFSGYFIGRSQNNESVTKNRLENPKTENLALEVKNNESEIVFDDNVSSTLLLNNDLKNNSANETRASRAANSRSSTRTSAPPQQLNSKKPSESQASTRTITSREKQERQTKAAKDKYYLQVIVTSNRDKAEYIKNQFREKKYPVYVIEQKGNDRNLYSIRLGNFTSKKTALRHLQFIRSNSPYKEVFIKKIN